VQLGVRAPGNAFLLLQRHLDELRRRGLQLAVCSTANRDDAVTILQAHPHMVVRDGHFAASRIGCTSTPGGVREIADELGIGLERMVFWDGCAAERARVRMALPEVLTPEVPKDPARHRQALVDLGLLEGLEKPGPSPR
jgi:predicted enzyme involved in methoxymalonyl-ACP biosynthesis